MGMRFILMEGGVIRFRNRSICLRVFSHAVSGDCSLTGYENLLIFAALDDFPHG
jgi:hypothetical protein